MRILRLVAENIQRLNAVEIVPDGSPVLVLAGDNEQGKSSCLDAIEMALGGKDAIPSIPVRKGAQKARVVVDLGDIVVTRKFGADGGGSLSVTNKDGAKYPSPQSLLDGLYSKLTFDPLAFATAKQPDQAATLRVLAGVDTTDIETERKKVFEERTLTNRDMAKAKAALALMPAHDVGTEPISIEALTKEIEQADAVADAVAKKDLEIASLRSAAQSASDRVERAKTAVEDARAAVEAAEIEAVLAGRAEAAAEADLQRGMDERANGQPAPDRAALRQRLADATKHNGLVAANRQRGILVNELRSHESRSEQLTSEIEALDAEKAKRLADAKFPVEGLSLDEHGVTWQGLPFEQASTAIRTRVSVAIGFALHPKLKVLLVRNGNDLDSKNLALIAEAAADAGGQLWLERIAGGNGLQTIVIENGAVKA